MRTLKKLRVGLLLLLLFLLLASVSRAAPYPTPGSLLRYALASGGQTVEYAPWTLTGTAGESVAGPVVFVGDRGLASGYWQKITGGGLINLPVIRR